MHPLADAATRAESEEVSRVGVGMRGSFREGVKIVLVPVWFETLWFWIAGGVGTDGPDVVEYTGAFGDQVALSKHV